jgi:ketosteroid isomerase-like protein
MSANLDLVRSIYAAWERGDYSSAECAPDVDVVPLFRDDDKWATVSRALARRFHPDIECQAIMFDGDRSGTGLRGFRAIWLEWLAPWATYRQELDETIDVGDRALMPLRDFGRREGSTQEVEANPAAIWTFRDGKIARWEVFIDRAQALKSAGLSE